MVAVETNMAKLASYLVNHIFSVFTSMWSVGMWSVGMWSVGILASCIVHIRNNMDILSLDLEIRVCIT